MNLSSLRGKTAIVGVSTFGCGEAKGFSEMEVLARSAQAAVSNRASTFSREPSFAVNSKSVTSAR